MIRLKKHSSIWGLMASPFVWTWHIISVIWPDRTATFVAHGDVSYSHQSTFSRFVRASVKGALLVWALWATYVHVYHRPLLQQRTAELEHSRRQIAQQFSDLATYHRQFTALHKQMSVIDDQILNTKKVNATVSDELMRNRLTLWAQLDFLQTKLDGIYKEGNYTPETFRLSDMMVMRQLTEEENRQLKQRNTDLETAMIAIADAESQLLSRIDKLASREIDGLETYMRKISGSLTSLGLSNLALADRAKSSDVAQLGGKLSRIEFAYPDKINPKYKELANKVDLWQGLDRLRTMLPVGNPVKNPYITSKFGDRMDPFGGQPSIHRGIDFAGQIGTPLYAVSHGRVTQAGERYGYGKSVEIDHGLGFTTLYAHLSDVRVKVGEYVETKDVIGLAGSSGRSTGPHLHYEVRYRGAPFNPYTFVDGRKIEY
ncbi:MAG: M23 family metallopeptidase [Rickettsiales bacterium]|jgi:murein DD-endopeptidase MepM/ murein hydrolase activator NlpD|nr:M23 family metallopeptidase [Rickettsiales bacterium]